MSSKILSVQPLQNSFKVWSNNCGEPEHRRKILYVVLFETDEKKIKRAFITSNYLAEEMCETIEEMEAEPFQEEPISGYSGNEKHGATWLSEIIIEGESFPQIEEDTAMHDIICKEEWSDYRDRSKDPAIREMVVKRIDERVKALGLFVK